MHGCVIVIELKSIVKHLLKLWLVHEGLVITLLPREESPKERFGKRLEPLSGLLEARPTFKEEVLMNSLVVILLLELEEELAV